MSLIRPFNGVVPRKDCVEKVVSRPFDTYSSSEVKSILETNPESFLRVIRPDFAPGGPQIKGDSLLKASRSTFLELLQNGILEQTDEGAFYIYRQIQGRFSHTGILATVPSR